MTTRVLCCGSRDWSYREVIRRELVLLGPDVVIAHGEAMGADKMAAAIARSLRLGVVGYAADWREHGPAAGVLRNQRMLDDFRPEFVLAFASGAVGTAISRGTYDMITRSLAAQVPVRVFRHGGRAEDPPYQQAARRNAPHRTTR